MKACNISHFTRLNEDLSQQLTAHEYAAATEMKPTRVHIAYISCITKKYSIFQSRIRVNDLDVPPT
jgi:hypothetical protein